MIEMKQIAEDRLGAIFVCDYCGKQIEDATRASFEFEYDEAGQPTGGLSFFHLPECSVMVEKVTGASPHWHHIDQLLLQLIYNSGLTLNDLHHLGQSTED
jgi:hypothetical protein